MLIASLASLLGFALFIGYGWVLDRLLRPSRDAWCRSLDEPDAGHEKTPPDPEI